MLIAELESTKELMMKTEQNTEPNCSLKRRRGSAVIPEQSRRNQFFTIGDSPGNNSGPRSSRPKRQSQLLASAKIKIEAESHRNPVNNNQLTRFPKTGKFIDKCAFVRQR